MKTIKRDYFDTKLIEQCQNDPGQQQASNYISFSRETNISIEEEITVLIDGDKVIFCKCDGYVVFTRGYTDGAVLELIDNCPNEEDLLKEIEYMKETEHSAFSSEHNVDIGYSNLEEYESTNNSSYEYFTKKKERKVPMEKPKRVEPIYKYDIIKRSIEHSSFKLVAHHNVAFKYERDNFLPVTISFQNNLVVIEKSLKNVFDFELKIVFPNETYDLDTFTNIGNVKHNLIDNSIYWQIDQLDGLRHEMMYREFSMNDGSMDLIAHVNFSVKSDDCTRYDVLMVDGRNDVYVKKMVKVSRYEVRMKNVDVEGPTL